MISQNIFLDVFIICICFSVGQVIGNIAYNLTLKFIKKLRKKYERTKI